MSTQLNIDLQQIENDRDRANWQVVAELIRRLNLQLVNESQLNGFEFLEFTIDSAVTNKKITHNFGEIPKDVVQTSLTGGGAITYNYDKFSATELDVTTTGPVTVRAYIGTHKEGSGL